VSGLAGHGRKGVDVVVFGGGPAGVSTALTAARAGADVLVVERSPDEAGHVGECFPPVIQTVLATLDLWAEFSSGPHLSSWGIRSVWGSPVACDRSFLFDPYGAGWCVDRRTFDASLVAVAQASGVHVVRSGRLVACDRNLRDRIWRLCIAGPGGSLDVHARCLVDATGRASGLARRLGASRVVHDRLVGVYALVPDAVDHDGGAFALIEAVEDGWWYSAPLPRRRLAVGFMTDADICAQARLWDVSRWRARLDSAPHTGARVGGQRVDGGLHVVSANSSLVKPAGGPGWLAVGDAAMAIDPLAGQGVHDALQAGISAGRTMWDEDVWSETLGAAHAATICQNFEDYLGVRAAYYGRERRWPESHFWRRRHSAGNGGRAREAPGTALSTAERGS
jgi:flavin-dependent dehydrogenase